eukprot:RCo049458
MTRTPTSPPRMVGNVYILSENADTLARARDGIVPVVESYNSESKAPNPLYGVVCQPLNSLRDPIQIEQDQEGGVALVVLAVPRNLRRLCIMDENDDDDYKQIISHGRRIGAVLIAVVGRDASSPDEAGRKKAARAPALPSSCRLKKAADPGGLPEDALYHPDLERLFEAQPQLVDFKEKKLFFSFRSSLSEVQGKQLLEHLKPENLTVPRFHGPCIIS